MEGLIEKFAGQKVLVVGDVMVDSYINGRMERISPEAPVPVVTISNREERLGGAANVALNIQSLGAMPVLCSVVGRDKMGDRFKNLLTKRRISADGIIRSDNRPTTVKHRVMAGNHHVLRIDEETEESLKPDETLRLHSLINELIHGCSVVIIEDYDKGVISKETIDHIRECAKREGISVVVDPKMRNFDHFTQLGLFKPNFKELQEGIKRKVDKSNLDDVKAAVSELYEKLNCEAVMVTLSENGVIIKNANELLHFPAHYREISDVSGAGDTVVAVSALCWASGFSASQIAQVANLAGGLVCEHHGVVPIDKEHLTQEVAQLKLN